MLAARHRELGRDVAIKVIDLAGTGTDAETFRREGRALAALDHPHIVHVHDSIIENGLGLIVMELLAHGTLRDRATSLSIEAACAFGLITAEALGCAHLAGVLPRDIKPENLLFGEDNVMKIADFGFAKTIDGAGTLASRYAGTPRYMAPEQIHLDELRPATDLYAVGVILYELMMGRPPFPHGSESLRRQQPSPPSMTGVPGPIAEVIERVLAKDCADRYPSGSVFAAALASAAVACLGPSWLARSDVESRLSDEVRDVALGRLPSITA